ncbi:MAG: hypothetical protein AB1611_08225 [bacterium]
MWLSGQTAMRRLLNVTCVQTIYGQAKSIEGLKPAEQGIRQGLRQRHRLGDKPDDFTIIKMPRGLPKSFLPCFSLWLCVSVVSIF